MAFIDERLDLRRWHPHVPASRHTLAVAVRRVGTARGRHQTAERLRELAAEAEAWARVINPDGRTR